MKTTNNFCVSGFIVSDAKVMKFEKSSVARFGLAISRKEKTDKGETRVSAIQNVEAWKSNAAADEAFGILTKGKLIQVEGYFKPEEWTDNDGSRRNSVKWVATKFQEVTAEEETAEDDDEKPATTAKKPVRATKGKKKAE